MSFSTTFKHVAHIKWNVPFENSNTERTLTNLKQLKNNIRNGQSCTVHVGYDLTLHDVERVENLLNELLNRWKEQTSIPPPPKLYTFLQQLRDLETPTPTQMAEQIVREILTPSPTQNQSKADKKQAEIEAIKQKRRLDMLRNQNKKH